MKYRIPFTTLFIIVAALAIEFWMDSALTLSRISAYIAAYLSYLAVELGFHFGAIHRGLDKIQQYVQNPLRGIESIACIDHIDFRSFYVRFQHVLENEAEHYVDISYLHDEPPLCLPESPQTRYYNTLVDIVQSKPHVRFRRLVIASASNYTWLKNMCQEFRGCRNFSLRMLELGSSSTVRPLAVQCIDRSYTFLVAIATQEEIPRHRDVMIKDSSLTEKFQWYYHNMYNPAVSLLEAGDECDEGMQLLENYAPHSS